MVPFAKLATGGAGGTPAGRRNMAGVMAFVLALSLVTPAALQATDTPPEDYLLAVGFYNKEQWKLASESFQTFLKKNPRHPKAESARFFLALSLIKLDDFRQARDILRAFAKDYPKGRDAVAAGYWIGHCSYHLEDFPAAEKEFTEFLANAPGNRLREWALPFLGDVELRLKKPDSAIARFQESLQAHPEGAMADDARFGLAQGYEALGKPEDALKAYEELAARRNSPRAAEARLSIGALHFDAGRFAEAAAAYESVEQQFPQSPQAPVAQLNHGFALYQLGQFAQAIDRFDKAGQSEKYAPEAALWKGLSLKSLSDLPQAVEVLQSAYEKYRDRPLADRLLFQWADCEQRRGEFDRARALFLSVVERWPNGAIADESLHAACQAAVNSGNLPEADALLARFDREFPRNRLRLRQEILKGRVLAARNDLEGASRVFQSVIDATGIESTRLQARYYLGDALHKRRRFDEVLHVTEPLAALWEKGTGPAELTGVFVLRGLSQLELARAAARDRSHDAATERLAHCQAAAAAADRYLSLAGNGPLAAQAREAKTIALALAGDKPGAAAALDELRKNHSGTIELDRALYELGTIAYSRDDWNWAQSLFGELVERPKESRYHSRALADLGWTRFQERKFPEAAATFERLLADHPSDGLVPEAAFMRASALQQTGRIAEAQAAFAEAFERRTPESSDSGERRSSAEDHIFLAGLQSARLLVELKKLPEADTAYEALLARFGKRADADRVLDAWATVHYNAEDFSRADALFRRLVREYPDSPLSGNARLILAESDLLAGRLDQARQSFQALANGAMTDDATRQRALYQLMQIELDGKRWDELRQVCRDYLTRFPEGTYRWDAEWRWADADFYGGDVPAAKERLQKLLAAKDEDIPGRSAWFPQVWVLRAEAEFKLKEYDKVAETVAAFREWDAKSPFLYQADEVLGRSLKAQARFPEAREAFERVIADPHGKLTETAARSQFHIAETYHFEKNYEVALREYLKVDILYKFPDWQAAALLGAAGCQENLSRLEDAAKTYDDVLRQYPRENAVAVKAREGLERVRRKLKAG